MVTSASCMAISKYVVSGVGTASYKRLFEGSGAVFGLEPRPLNRSRKTAVREQSSPGPRQCKQLKQQRLRPDWRLWPAGVPGDRPPAAPGLELTQQRLHFAFGRLRRDEHRAVATTTTTSSRPTTAAVISGILPRQGQAGQRPSCAARWKTGMTVDVLQNGHCRNAEGADDRSCAAALDDDGWDQKRGGFVERLDKDGSPLETPRRVLVQARQIYCYAKAAQFNWYPGAKELALKGLDYMLDKARSPDGGFVHLLNADGSVADTKRDTYDHAFVLLALANVYQLGQDAQVRAEIDTTLRFIDQRLRSPHGGFIEGLPPAMPRRQNPQMHLFELMIALFDATGEPVFQNRAGDFFGLFVGNLFDQRTQVLGEYFEEDWSRINPVVVEPGHLAEWTWLLKV